MKPIHRSPAPRRRPTLSSKLTAFALIALASIALGPAPLDAQSDELRRAQASRAELEALASRAEQEAASASDDATRRRLAADAASIRQRLRDGDFQVGDRVIVSIDAADAPRVDTLTVRQERRLELPNLLTTSLQGVLRSELQEHVAREVARVIREPRVQARSLLRVAVLGEVERPGFYWMTADALVSDAIMTAGGPTSAADPSRTIVRRGAEELWRHADVSDALRAGYTLDQMMLRAGDELVVGKKKVRDSESTFRVMSMVVGLLASVATAATLIAR